MTDIPRLTRGQAAIIGLFTGLVVGPFQDIHELAEQTLGRTIWAHEYASGALHREIREKFKDRFLALAPSEDAPPTHPDELTALRQFILSTMTLRREGTIEYMFVDGTTHNDEDPHGFVRKLLEEERQTFAGLNLPGTVL